MSHLEYLLGGMLLAWGVVFAYVWHLARRTERLGKQLDSARDRLPETKAEEA